MKTTTKRWLGQMVAALTICLGTSLSVSGMAEAVTVTTEVEGSLEGAAAGAYEGPADEDVTVDGAVIRVAGDGHVTSWLYGGCATSRQGAAEASGCSAVVETGGEVSSSVYGGRAMGRQSAEASGNEVKVDGLVQGMVNGGYAAAWAEAAPAAADGNRVTLRENGDSGSITGGSADGYGSGSASKNTVTILGQVRGDVTGGAEGEHGSGTEVAGNVVNLLKGSIEGNVYGGRSNLGTAVQNKVNFYGGSVGGTIYAGAIGDGGALSPAAAENENQLNIYGQELAAGNILGMGSLNFYLPNDAAAGTVLLRLTAAEDVDLSGVSIGADLDNGAGAGLSAGDTIALLVANGRILADGAIANAAETLHSIARSHGLRLSVSPDGHTLLATVTEAVEP